MTTDKELETDEVLDEKERRLPKKKIKQCLDDIDRLVDKL